MVQEEKPGGGGSGGGTDAGYGAGNPIGGTGGLIILYASDIENNGQISSEGASGEDKLLAGGSSGGGSINIFYGNTYINNGSVSKKGGTAFGDAGKGGEGTITIGNISSGSFVP